MTSMGSRRLASYVEVDGVWYGPDDNVPDEVADKITNEGAWASDEQVAVDEQHEEQQRRSGTSTGARLASYVEVNGRMYGPNDPVPDHVAAQITNASAWAGGELPAPAQAALKERADTVKVPQPPALPGAGDTPVRAQPGGPVPDAEGDGDGEGEGEGDGGQSDGQGERAVPGGAESSRGPADEEETGESGERPRTAAKKTAGRRASACG
jgi:hypothetical protein